jgi:uncharacterized membrane protein YjjB (DUF3815 family)
MQNALFQIIAAFIGTLSFSILFSTPNKYLIHCGLVGALGWSVYLLAMNRIGHAAVAVFIASTVLTICSRYLARLYKATTTLFLISGIFPLVPGAGIYYTAYYTITAPGATAIYYGMSSLKTAIAIGLGIGVAYSLPHQMFGWNRRN